MFIELTESVCDNNEYDGKVILNTDFFSKIPVEQKNGLTEIMRGNILSVFVKETPEEIMQKIKEAS